MEKILSLMEFQKKFTTEETCFDYLVKTPGLKASSARNAVCLFKMSSALGFAIFPAI
ncbi:MAG: hypothetical protein HQ591_05665 [candidate division Zixibacteria bacterium]|nr:hypothetical protein [Candidatus Tariuqbacter arcticus]